LTTIKNLDRTTNSELHFSELKEAVPFVSIIVIVLNMEKTISDCLNSLVRLNYPSDRFEIIVIDGGSKDQTHKIIESYPKAKKIVDYRRNRSLARNLGVQNSEGSIIAFTDADCEVDKDWLSIHVLDHQNNANVAAICGSVLSTYKDEKEMVIRIANDSDFDVSSDKRFIYFLTTSNSTLKRDKLIEVGGFEEKIHAGEDAVLSSKIVSKGFKILFDPSAKVIHRHYNNARENESDYHDIIKRGKVQFNLQLIQPKLRFRLPMNPIIMTILLPSVLILRTARFFQKMRFIQNKVVILRQTPFLFFYSFWWVFGYFSAILDFHRQISEKNGDLQVSI
jgi:glycosyltransferase involved in cell wall biosynthesis